MTLNRRRFLKDGAIVTGAALTMLPSISTSMNNGILSKKERNTDLVDGELLHNGIVLPASWPPRDMRPDAFDPMPVPYLTSPPAVIPIDTGRQLFVDDFLIERTGLVREFHQPVKHPMNPLIRPVTSVEMNNGICPMAAPFSDGCFYDSHDRLFKLWYQAGWFGESTALAISSDGIHWERPKFDVVPGTNVVIRTPGFCRDGVSVWIDHDTSNPDERFKLYMFLREGRLGGKLKDHGGLMWTSRDGIHWKNRGDVGVTGDNSTFFYNPFRKKWVFTVRAAGRPAPPWSDNPWNSQRKGRARSYWENTEFLAALGAWKGYDPVFWLGADRLDQKRADYSMGQEPQLYKVDAAGYESITIGFLQIHYGPTNRQCAQGGFPKLTELQLAFSRDGFHWDRTNRKTFIDGTLQKDSWERAYIHSVGGVCNVVGDKLLFYYTAFQGDESKAHPTDRGLAYWSGMYANAAMGVAVLRRDGFASMNAGDKEDIILTRIVRFTGKHLFVNVDGAGGELRAEICNENGEVIQGFAHDESEVINTDTTKQIVAWKNSGSVESLAGRPVRFRFYLTRAKLFSFWVSKNNFGVSGGATAGGGPGLIGNWDV